MFGSQRHIADLIQSVRVKMLFDASGHLQNLTGNTLIGLIISGNRGEKKHVFCVGGHKASRDQGVQNMAVRAAP